MLRQNAGLAGIVSLAGQHSGLLQSIVFAQLIAQSVATTEPLLALLDQHLSRQSFMAGDQLTMADLPLACEVHRWVNLPQPQTERPHLDRWYQAMCARPSSRGILDIVLA